MKRKELSKEERIKIYKDLLYYFENDYCTGGFCLALDEIKYRPKATSAEAYCDKIKDFPELMKYKPPKIKNGQYWFEEYSKQRIEILNTILNELSQ
jgi:hypothetical protein